MLIRSITRRDLLAAAAATLAVAGPSTPTTRPRLPTPRGPLTGLATTCLFDPTAEVARLRGELAQFGRDYLPRLLARRAIVPRHAGAELIEVHVGPDRLAAWRSALGRLGRALPGGGFSWREVPLEPASFGEFLVEPAAGDWIVGPERIDWRLSPLPWSWAEHRVDVARELLGDAAIAAIAEGGFERRYRPLLRRGYLAVPTDRLLDPNRPAALLPALAEADPDFARRAIDPRALEAAVRADRTLTPGEAERHVGDLRSYFYGAAVSSALARLLAGLANNRFDAIGRFLDLPEVHGPWKGFMPRFLFAVLLGKATVLRDTTRSYVHVGGHPGAFRGCGRVGDAMAIEGGGIWTSGVVDSRDFRSYFAGEASLIDPPRNAPTDRRHI